MIGMIIKQLWLALGDPRHHAVLEGNPWLLRMENKYLIWRFFSLKLGTCRLGTGVTSEGEFLHLPKFIPQEPRLHPL